MNKKTASILIIIAAVVVAIFVMYSAFGGHKNTVKSKPLDVEQMTSDWKVYTNSDYSFTIKYPSDWNVLPKGLDSTGSFVTNFGTSTVENTPPVVVIVYQDQNDFQAFIKPFDVVQGTRAYLTIDGATALQINNDDAKFTMFAFVKNGKGYVISSTATYQRADIAWLMATTFKFVK